MNFDRSQLNDTYRLTGKCFRLPDENRNNSDKGEYSSPEGTVDQSETQRDPGLHASGGKMNGPSIRGAEGRAFPTEDNGKESEDEFKTFAGNRAPDVGVSLVTGQITSPSNPRLVPTSTMVKDKINVRVAGKRVPGDAKSDRIGE